MTKVCGGEFGCGEHLPLDHFYLDRNRNIYQTMCKVCISAHRKMSTNEVVKRLKGKKCASCDTRYEDIDANFDRYGSGGLKPYCKNEGCKQTYYINHNYNRKSKPKSDAYITKTKKNREMRINIIRAKFIDWQMNYPKEMK